LPLLSGKNGLITFGVIAMAVLACCLVAYLATGDKGIEERFAHAVGFNTGQGEEEEGAGLLGFNIEGNVLLYGIVLLFLVAACFLLYRKFGV
jgi:hypothetical protein